MPKSLADGHIKIAILTTAPANLAAPTVAELNAGINAAARILASDWMFSPTDLPQARFSHSRATRSSPSGLPSRLASSSTVKSTAASA